MSILRRMYPINASGGFALRSAQLRRVHCCAKTLASVVFGRHLAPVRDGRQTHQVGKHDDKLIKMLSHANKVKQSPHFGDGRVVVGSERMDGRTAMARESDHDTRLAIERAVPEAQRHALVHKVMVPRHVRGERGGVEA